MSSGISDATATNKGIIKLTGGLGGTADSPTLNLGTLTTEIKTTGALTVSPAEVSASLGVVSGIATLQLAHSTASNGWRIDNNAGSMRWVNDSVVAMTLQSGALILGNAMTVQWPAALIQTTVGAAGGASALPATPTGYLKVKNSAGTVVVVPYYAAS